MAEAANKKMSSDADRLRPLRKSFRRSSRSVPHPGAFLETRFMQPLSISQAQLSLALGVSRRRINELVVGKRSITPDTAIKLAKFFSTDPEFWLTLQMHWDLQQALQKRPIEKN